MKSRPMAEVNPRLTSCSTDTAIWTQTSKRALQTDYQNSEKQCYCGKAQVVFPKRGRLYQEEVRWGRRREGGVSQDPRAKRLHFEARVWTLITQWIFKIQLVGGFCLQNLPKLYTIRRSYIGKWTGTDPLNNLTLNSDNQSLRLQPVTHL